MRWHNPPFGRFPVRPSPEISLGRITPPQGAVRVGGRLFPVPPCSAACAPSVLERRCVPMNCFRKNRCATFFQKQITGMGLCGWRKGRPGRMFRSAPHPPPDDGGRHGGQKQKNMQNYIGRESANPDGGTGREKNLHTSVHSARSGLTFFSASVSVRAGCIPGSIFFFCANPPDSLPT